MSPLPGNVKQWLGWRLAWWCLAGGTALAGSAVGLRLHADLRKSRAERASLSAKTMTTEQRLQQLEQDHAALTQKFEQVSADRDNVMSQLKRAFQEQADAKAAFEQLTPVFKRTAGERLELLSRLAPLEDQVVDLRQTEAQLVQERQALQDELTKAQSRQQERELRATLEKERGQKQQATKEYQAAQRAINELTTRLKQSQTDTTKLKTRLDSIQERYAGLMSENRTLQHRSKTLPKDVTTLAQEHEQLVKELADTHYNMGVMFAKRRDFTRAEKEFQQVVQMRPDDADAHYNLGVIYAEHLQDRDRAIKIFRKYLALRPDGQDASWVKQYIASWNAWEAKERLE